jgi:diguanylate cyclase (GGDEF)-like protein
MLRFTPLPLAMVLVDLDDFKRINDEYTHLIGDEVLREVAACLSEQVGPTDRVLRYGGDEFVVLLQGRADAEARLAADRMRTAIHGLDWDAVAAGLRVRATTGCAALYALTGRHPATDGERLFRRADESLLAAKRAARPLPLAQATQLGPVPQGRPPAPAPTTPTEHLDLREVSRVAARLPDPARARHAVGEEESTATPAAPVPPVRRPGRRAAVIDLTGVQERTTARE